jgi:hypothetical protein
MRFYTQQHQFYCGIDLHARSMYLCILNQDGELLEHRNMKAAPEPFLKAIAPYREDLVVCVECVFTWYWLADLCAREGIAFVLGPRSLHEGNSRGKAKNDKITAHKIAVLLRGGMLPEAYVYPADMRATRDLLRRRMHLMHKRAELLAHIQKRSAVWMERPDRHGHATVRIAFRTPGWAACASRAECTRAARAPPGTPPASARP